MIKKWDIVIIISLILLSFLPQLIFGVIMGKQYNETYAVITIDGSLYKKIPLSAHGGKDEFKIETKYGTNTVRVIDQTIQITDADCRDHICVKQGVISKPGQTIVCLPHKLLIEVKSYSNKNQDVVPLG